MRSVALLLCVFLAAPAAAVAKSPPAAPSQPAEVEQLALQIRALSIALTSLYDELDGVLAAIEQLTQEMAALGPPGAGGESKVPAALAARVDELEARIDRAKTQLDEAQRGLAEVERQLPNAKGDRKDAAAKLEAAKAMRLKTRKRWWTARKLLRALKRTQFRTTPRPTK